LSLLFSSICSSRFLPSETLALAVAAADLILARDFQGFLNDLQDWELKLQDKDKRLKPLAGSLSTLYSLLSTSTSLSIDLDLLIKLVGLM
ncbi:hypothetical protein LINPERHAP1_LOCUS20261, partial [Linum perenne]